VLAALALATLEEAKTWARTSFLPLARLLGVQPLRLL
jgi:hypothetical protein